MTDDAGAVRVELLRFEDLEAEAMRYFGLGQSLRRRNVSGHAPVDYRTFYTRHTIQTVADWYAADIDLFGFDFDTPASRNVAFPGS